ncbi:MAG: hypothetical protein GX144_12340, partial [Clostridiaceae bacterium]|nr:hypothetical protein [Clostridiaceae bacterium]
MALCVLILQQNFIIQGTLITKDIHVENTSSISELLPEKLQKEEIVSDVEDENSSLSNVFVAPDKSSATAQDMIKLDVPKNDADNAAISPEAEPEAESYIEQKELFVEKKQDNPPDIHKEVHTEKTTPLTRDKAGLSTSPIPVQTREILAEPQIHEQREMPEEMDMPELVLDTSEPCNDEEMRTPVPVEVPENEEMQIDNTNSANEPDIFIDQIQNETVPAPAISITNIFFTEEAYTMMVNETCQTVVQVVYNDDTTADITAMCVFDISDKTVAEIDAGGVLSAKKPGQAQACAEYNGRSCSADVFVQPQPVNVPVNLRADSFPNRINISWDEVEYADLYEVEADGNSCTVAQTVYTHSALFPNTTHTYRIKAANEYGTSEWSSVLSVMTKLETPVNLTAVTE